MYLEKGDYKIPVPKYDKSKYIFEGWNVEEQYWMEPMYGWPHGRISSETRSLTRNTDGTYQYIPKSIGENQYFVLEAKFIAKLRTKKTNTITSVTNVDGGDMVQGALEVNPTEIKVIEGEEMSIYTKRGDRGITDMAHAGNISKSDDRIRLMGEADELNSHIELVKSMLRQSEILQLLERIQKNLDLIAAGVSNPYDRDCKVSEKETAVLEAETDKLEALCEKPVPEKLTGKSRLAAEIDIARTVARRTERCLAQVSVKFGADTESKRFLNRLSDYLYILARYIEYYSDLSVELSDDHAGALAKTSDNNTDALPEPSDSNTDVLKKTADINEAVIQEVLKRMGIQSRITLDTAKKLIERLEQEAVRRGQRAVIAVCNPEGNPVAVHVMDGAFLVSFDVAMKKAYTAVAVKMSTMELSKIAQPGETFYGVDKLDGGKIVIFGGGIPLKSGNTIIGGLGISGGTGEEDHSLAEYGQSVLNEIL